MSIIIRRSLQILRNRVNITYLQEIYANTIVTSIVSHTATKLGQSLWDFMILFISYGASH